MATIGIIGMGYWGPNLLRNFIKTDGVTVKMISDLDEAKLAKHVKGYPAVATSVDHTAIVNDADIDAVVIATPASTHFPLAKQALESGKHVLVEKPLAVSFKESNELLALAKKQKKIIMVDHTFVYEDAVQKIQSLIEDNAIGTPLYFDSTRINLGLIQKDTNVLWDLAVHDLAILQSFASLADVTSVFAYGHKHHTNVEEIAHLHLEFRNGMSAHIHVSWLSPVKIRQTLIGGAEKMIVYNDNEPSEKIRIYDKGVTVKKEEQTFALPVYRSGDILIPRLLTIEPLAELARHFVACINGKEQPRTSGEDGARVVEILELADASLNAQSVIRR